MNWESQKRIFWDLENVRIEGGKKEGRLREKQFCEEKEGQQKDNASWIEHMV